MLHNKKSTRLFKYLLPVPLACMLCFVFSCEKENRTPVNGSTTENPNGDHTTTEEPATQDQVFTAVENPPEPEGGMQNFFTVIGEHLDYPEDAKANNIEGTVYLEFIIDKEGQINNVQVKKGIDEDCDKAAIAALKEAARTVKFTPGSQNDHPVKVKMILPVRFKLG